MPESKVRKGAAAKKKQRQDKQLAEQRQDQASSAPGTGARWVVPAFITVGLLGVAWLVVYYLAGPSVPGMSALGDWNILIGMALMAAAFVLATFWK